MRRIKNIIKKLPVIGKTVVAASAFWKRKKESIHTWILFLKNKNLLKRNVLLQGKYDGKRCFILATGTSVKEQDLKVLAGEYSMSINNFFLHPDLSMIKPTWHVFPPTHDPITDTQAIAWFTEAEKRFPKEQKVFSALTDKYLIDAHGFFKNRDLHYYLWGEKDMSLYKEIRLDRSLPRTATNVHTAALIAIALGFKKIYLIGVDHDWLLHPDRKQNHFYNEEEDTLWKLGYRPETNQKPDLEWTFFNYQRLWKIHKQVKRIAETNGAEIINLSPTSMLDVFPKQKLEDVLGEPRL